MAERFQREALCLLGNAYFQVYLVKGEKSAALIETGVSATTAGIVAELTNLGIRPDYLIITHPHSDHVCGLASLRQAYPDAKVIAGKGAAAFLDHPRTAAALIHEDRHMATFLAAEGLVEPPEYSEGLPSLQGSLPMGEGDELDLGGVTLHFMEAKGHAPGNILVHIPALDTILAADSLGYRCSVQGFFPVFFTGYRDYLETIDRIADFKPRALGMAHHGFLQDVAVNAAIKKARDDARRMRKRIMTNGTNEDVLAQEIFQDYYRDELTLYSPGNILSCCRLLVRRARDVQQLSV
ncbi:MAG: MBL fold metallo-hydrolase [Smithellaceae bacterium]|nr:MBL fold metallo-hydrolase [Smithellaceae bacterium]